MLIPKTNTARRKLNLANTRAHAEGFYYKPRLFLSDLINNFDQDELYITTACVAGLLKDEAAINGIFLPLYNKFGNNVLLEVQPHNVDIQKDLNKKALDMAKKFNLRIIAANDSHYIYKYNNQERDTLLKGKGLNYNHENEFILDYPTYDEFYQRFKLQGILSDDEIQNAIDNTLIFDECENIDINNNIKMPTIYKNLNDEEKMDILKDILNKDFKKMIKEEGVTKDQLKVYKKEVLKEAKVIENTKQVHSVDYFLFNYRLMKLAIDKYGGVLTRSGRGSCGAFLINKVLGITQIDRLNTTLPIYSERFMSTARLLENRAMPDIDYNVVAQEPFIKASKELLGEHGCYPMIAYGTLGESDAFRNICRARKIEYSEYNEVAKNIDHYRPNEKWGPLIKEASKYVGTIVSKSPHPCAYVLSNSDIREEIGLVRVGDELCALITSDEADEWKYLKNDYLIVTVWEIISATFKEIGEPIPKVSDLLGMIDDSVWKLFEDGITATLNQIDGSWATSLVKIFKPKTVEELAMFVACIRPSFNSFRNDFINRRPYSTGSKALDKIFENTHSYVLFQENLMQYFEWLGITPSESISLIKKISKKKIKPEDFSSITERIKNQWIINTGSQEGFDETWEDMQSMMSYGFNTPHGLAYAIDCLYCAYLKANYPLEYYTMVLNIYEKNETKTDRLTKELEYFDIKMSSVKFGYSMPNYNYDRETRKIYKSLASIKFMNKEAAEDLCNLYSNKYTCFTDLLADIAKTAVDSRQLTTLIKLDYFESFGEIHTLIQQNSIFNMFYKKQRFSLADISSMGITDELVEAFGGTKKPQTVIGMNNMQLIKYLCENRDYPKTTIIDKINYQNELLGYIDIVIPTIDKNCAYVLDVNKKYANKIVKLYRLKTGETEVVKVKAKNYDSNPIDANSIIKTIEAGEEKRWRKIAETGKWGRLDETEMILYKWSMVEC